MKSTLSQGPFPARFSIGTLAAASGLPASTIRYWERVGALPAPPRQSGQRRYTEESLTHLAILQLAQSCGFALPEMRALVQGFRGGAPSERWRATAARKRDELETRIRQLQSMRKMLDRFLHCECVDWQHCARLASAAKKDATA